MWTLSIILIICTILCILCEQNYSLTQKSMPISYFLIEIKWICTLDFGRELTCQWIIYMFTYVACFQEISFFECLSFIYVLVFKLKCHKCGYIARNRTELLVLLPLTPGFLIFCFLEFHFVFFCRENIMKKNFLDYSLQNLWRGDKRCQ